MDTYSLHAVLSEDIKNSGRTQASVANQISISKPTLSQVLKGDKAISLQLLDGITLALDKPVGYYYDLYIEECFSGDGKRPRKPKKLEKYVLHCLDLCLDSHALGAINRMLEEGGYLANIYEIGEELFKKEYFDKAFTYFELVTKYERDRTATHLAMSFYRQLIIVRNRDTDQSEEIAIRLRDYLDYVKDEDVLEAYYKVIAVFRIKEKWDHILTLGEKLITIARSRGKFDYVGDALIKLAIAAREKGDIALALNYHDKCMEVPIGNYRLWAEGNKYITLISAGCITSIQDLFKFCMQHRELSYEGLEVLLESAVKHDMHEVIYDFFNCFPEHIERLEEMRKAGAIHEKRYITLVLAKAVWALRKGGIEGVQAAIEAAELATSLRLRKQALQGIKLVFQYAGQNTPEYQRGLMLLDEIA